MWSAALLLVMVNAPTDTAAAPEPTSVGAEALAHGELEIDEDTAPPAAAPPLEVAKGPCAVLVAAPSKLPARAVKRLRANLGVSLQGSGFVPLGERALGKKLRAADQSSLTTCFDDDSCLGELAGRLGVFALATIRVHRKGRRFGAEVRLWSTDVHSDWVTVGPAPVNRLNLVVAMALDDAIAMWTDRSRAVLVARAEAEAAIAQEAARLAAEAKVIEAVPAESIAIAAPLEGDERRFEDPAWAESSTFSFQLGVGGGIFPLAHYPTRLVTSDVIGDAPFGTGGLALALRFRIPALPIDELFIMVQAEWGVDLPLLVMTFAPGVEKRWRLGRWAPGLGARYSLGLLGLPVPAGGGRGMGLNLSHGVEAYGTVAVELDPVPLSLQVSVGYRLHPKVVNQFSAGGATYFTRDSASQVWTVDLSGLTSTLMVIYAL